MEHDATENSGLRHRTTAHPRSPPELDAAEPTARPAPATSGSPDEWESQLAAARRALADRLGPEEDADFVPTETAKAGEERVDRRGSDASDGDAEVVQALLGTNRERPPVLDEAAEDARERRETPVEAEPEREANPVDERICRICFDGEDEELGRLFSPCQCRGTSRFVHVACLDRWRTASAGATSFFKCDQCGYEYKLARSKIAGLAQNKLTILFSTSILFILLIYLAGFVANGLLYAVEKRTQSLTGSPYIDIFVSDYVIVGEGMREAVEFFGKTVDKSGWKAIAPAADDPGTDERENSWFRSMAQGRKRKEQAKARKPPRVRRIVEHFIKGFSLVGISAFFQTFVATALFGPFGLRGSLFRAVRPNRRNGDNETNLSQIVIVLFVLVGVVKAVQSTYHLVQFLTKKALRRVEGMVLDV